MNPPILEQKNATVTLSIQASTVKTFFPDFRFDFEFEFVICGPKQRKGHSKEPHTVSW